MRILLVVLHFNSIGGIEIYERNLASILEKLGQEPEIWCLLESGDKNCVCKENEVNIYYLFPTARFRRGIFYRLRHVILFTKLLREAKRFDLTIAMHPAISQGIYLASIFNKDMKYWVWAYGSDLWHSWSRFFQKGIEKADKIIAVSQFTANIIKEKMDIKEDNIFVIYPPVDTDWFRPLERVYQDSGKVNLLTVSRLGMEDMYKGIDTVIKTLPALRRRLEKEIIYRVIGDGSGVPHLKILAQSLGVDKHVEFIGRVDKQRLLQEYQNCDLFIMPSRMGVLPSGYLTGEGFGIVYAEAAACGKPVVGSKHGGAAEAVLDGVTGYTVDPTNVDEIVNAVCDILGNPDKAKRMGQAGRKFVEKNFGMDMFKKRIVDLLEDM